jgi:hypothetical protein
MNADTIRQQVRLNELRQTLRSVRAARAALEAGSLRAAVRAHAEAVRSLHFLLGLFKWTTATAGLAKVVFRLGTELEQALPARRPLALPDRDHLVETIKDGILVLKTRDGIDVDDEHARERAANIAGQILAEAEADALDASADASDL